MIVVTEARVGCEIAQCFFTNIFLVFSLIRVRVSDRFGVRVRLG